MFYSLTSILLDTVLMNELPHSLLALIMVPLLQKLTSRNVLFLSGYRSRLVLLLKWFDALYMIGLRIGQEMARQHLTALAVGIVGDGIIFSQVLKLFLYSSDFFCLCLVRR